MFIIRPSRLIVLISRLKLVRQFSRWPTSLVSVFPQKLLRLFLKHSSLLVTSFVKVNILFVERRVRQLMNGLLRFLIRLLKFRGKRLLIILLLVVIPFFRRRRRRSRCLFIKVSLKLRLNLILILIFLSRRWWKSVIR